jgi:hypothetical protein
MHAILDEDNETEVKEEILRFYKKLSEINPADNL